MIHRTIIQVEVFTEGPYEPPMSLESIEYDMNYGDCIGTWTTVSCLPVLAEEIEGHLLRIGNDGTFFDAILEDDSCE